MSHQSTKVALAFAGTIVIGATIFAVSVGDGVVVEEKPKVEVIEKDARQANASTAQQKPAFGSGSFADDAELVDNAQGDSADGIDPTPKTEKPAFQEYSAGDNNAKPADGNETSGAAIVSRRNADASEPASENNIKLPPTELSRKLDSSTIYRE